MQRHKCGRGSFTGVAAILAMLSRAPNSRRLLDFGLPGALPIGQDGGAPWTVSG